MAATSYAGEDTGEDTYTYVDDMVTALNIHRLEAGLMPLTHFHGLSEGAQQHADWLARSCAFVHLSPDELTARIKEHGFVRTGVPYECLCKMEVYEDESIGITIDELMNSTDHRECLLESKATHVGVGATLVDDDSGETVVVVWIAPGRPKGKTVDRGV